VRLLVAVLFIFSFVYTAYCQEDYEFIFEKDYLYAISYIKINKASLIHNIQKNGGDAEVLVPVIFPEIVRYSIIRDKMETAGLKVFYVNFGEKYANFSIGLFQMKPSFIEKMEEYVKENQDLLCCCKVQPCNNRELYDYGEVKDDKEKRAMRVAKLENRDWQIKYLSCFYNIVKNKYKGREWKNKEEEIKFYSSAYNRGFWCSEEEINRWMNVKNFPHGKNYAGKQYVYSDVAINFYKKYWVDMLKESMEVKK
jgi:hypothetical protein